MTSLVQAESTVDDGLCYSVSSLSDVVSSTFTISGTETAFVVGISGLTLDDFSITESMYRGYYYYQDNAVIDAEKYYRVDTDNQACWAGATANLLYYTGWLDGFGFTDESDAFDFFLEHFYLGDLYGGHTYYAAEWFLSGEYDPAGAAGYDQVLAGGGGYYSSVITSKNITDYIDYENDISVSALTDAVDRLNEGCGVQISFSVYNSSGTRTSGHATTLWGFTYDTSLSVTDPNYYTGIIITDSDDDNGNTYDDTRDAPDTLKIIPITYDSSLGAYILDSAYISNARIEMLTYIAPNTEGWKPSIPEEPQNVVKVYKAGSLVSSSSMVSGKTVVRNGDVDRVHVYDGGTLSNTQIDSKGLVAMSGGVMLDTTVNSKGQLFISGGTASRTTVNSGGSMHIYSGGSAESATVNSGGSMHIYNGGSATCNEVADGGKMYVHSGGSAEDTTVCTNAYMHVSSHAAATGILVSGIGNLYVYENGTLTDVELIENGRLYVSGGCVSNAAVNSGGSMMLKSGGSAENVTVSSGVVYVSSGTQMTDVSLDNGGRMNVHSSGTGKDILINSGGSLFVSGGGTAENIFINSSGRLCVYSGGTGENILINSGGSLFVSSGGTASVLFNPWRGAISAHSAATVSYFERDAKVYFGSGGGFISKTNDTVTDQTVTSGGSMILYSSGRHTGVLNIESGGVVSAYEGSIIEFDLRDEEPEGNGLINDLSCVKGAPAYTITIDNASSGLYVLAGNAADFTGTITVTNADNNSSFTLTVNDKTPGIYHLFTADNALMLDISNDVTPPEIVIDPYPTAPTNQPVVITATFSDNKEVAFTYYRIDGGNWIEYENGVTMTDNGTLQFKAIDSTGNEAVSDVITIRHIDKDPPTFDVALTQDILHVYSFVMTAAEQVRYQYNIDGGDWIDVEENSFTVTVNGTYYIQAIDRAGNVSSPVHTETISGFALENPAVLENTEGRISWGVDGEQKTVLVQYSVDGFKTAVTLQTSADTLDMLSLPQNVQVRIKGENCVEWAECVAEVEAETDSKAQLLQAVGDGTADIFFARTDGTWNGFYQAVHRGSHGGWTGTGESVFLSSKNRITDMFYGAEDASILYLTDDANGDALFMDDIFSDSYEWRGRSGSRLAALDEIRAGAGNDIVDLTSAKFGSVDSGMIIRGGDGNDTIWTNSGNNQLFGDEGNDRIVGASGNDVIAGGAGNDTLHGGGGKDIFTFGGNWGNDTVEQLSNGTVTLWFESGSREYWDAESMTYNDGSNSVTVIGSSDVSLKFGDDGSSRYDELVALGAFADSTSQNVFADADSTDPVIAVL